MLKRKIGHRFFWNCHLFNKVYIHLVSDFSEVFHILQNLQIPGKYATLLYTNIKTSI